MHGLGGGAFTTWTDKDTGNLWLRDLLPQFFPNSRIMSYGYDASVHPSRSTLDILNYAENLLFELNTYRRSEKVRYPVSRDNLHVLNRSHLGSKA